jgi:beta-N-acetylhexosaminidase
MSIGPVMLDLEGLEPTADELEMLRHPAVGGVILFSRNYRDPEQLQRLTARIHGARDPHLLVAVDQEGGRVQRFREGFTRLPPAARFGELYRQDPKRALRLCEQAGWLMATELRASGLDFSFAPVLDVDSGISEVIGDRAFGPRNMQVADLAAAWMRGCHAAGMAAVGKHFPGHGGVRADSHLELPEDGRSLAELEMEDLLPFQRLIGAGLEAIMPAHVVYSRVDARPAGFSALWLRDILRRRLGFQGVIFSDDLNMAAARQGGGFAERARAALQAGCDMVLVCNNPRGAAEVLDELRDYSEPAAHLRMVRMHGRQKLNRERMHLDPAWHRAVQALSDAFDNPDPQLDL